MSLSRAVVVHDTAHGIEPGSNDVSSDEQGMVSMSARIKRERVGA